MSISTSSEYKPLRRSHSLPHIAVRHDSGVSGITASTNITTGSCSLLDQIDVQARHYHKIKCNHNYHHHNNHQQYENVSDNPSLSWSSQVLLSNNCEKDTFVVLQFVCFIISIFFRSSHKSCLRTLVLMMYFV